MMPAPKRKTPPRKRSEASPRPLHDQQVMLFQDRPAPRENTSAGHPTPGPSLLHRQTLALNRTVRVENVGIANANEKQETVLFK